MTGREARSGAEHLDRALDPVQRRLQGQHFTASRVADLINAFCIRSGGDHVLDPACGTGAFLLRARARLLHLGGEASTLRGVEIDARLASMARLALPRTVIVTGDFLAREAVGSDAMPEEATLDAVIGNPPYVRQELLGAAMKNRLQASSQSLSRRSDLHVYFWQRAMSLLKPGGRLGFLTSGAWLDAAYGDELRAWLARSFRLVALIESESESWFDDARVRTVVTIVEKAPAGAAAACARFARIKPPLDQIAPEGLAESERLARFEQLAHDIERGATAARVRSIAQDQLSGSRWGPLLRQPDLWFEILERAAGRFVPLSEIATVRWGIKTGDDKLFYIRSESPTRVEPRFLVPVVFNLMELDRLAVTSDQLHRRLLLVDLRTASIEGLEVARYIQAAQHKRGSHLRPTCAARERRGDEPRRWFELRPGPAGAILWSIMHQYRHVVPLNPERFAANDNLLLIDPLPGIEARLLAALLNSHLQVLIKLAHGRQRNEGMLKTQAVDVKGMLVPDTRRMPTAVSRRLLEAFEPIARRPIGTVIEECSQPDRRRLDLEVMRSVGFPRSEAAALVDRLYAALMSIYRDERRWEKDAVARRTGARRAGDPRATKPGPRPAQDRSASAPAV